MPYDSPSRLTPQVRATAVRAVKRGATHLETAEAIGVSDRTLRRWLQAGREDPTSAYGAFAARLKAARQDYIARIFGSTHALGAAAHLGDDGWEDVCDIIKAPARLFGVVEAESDETEPSHH